jgi:hypothetical protein
MMIITKIEQIRGNKMYYIKEIISNSRVLVNGFNACLNITLVNRKRFRHNLKYE